MDTTYTTVDQNATGVTTVYPSGTEALIYGVSMGSVSTSAVAVLELTDGANVANLTPSVSAGAGVDHPETIAVPKSDSLQVRITTANSDGVGGNETAVVYRGNTFPNDV